MPKYIAVNIPNQTKVEHEETIYTVEWEIEDCVDRENRESFEPGIISIYPDPKKVSDVPIIHNLFHKKLRMELKDE